MGEELKRMREKFEKAWSLGNGAGRNFAERVSPKRFRNMPPTRTAYRLGFVNAGKYCEVDFNNGSPNR